MKTRMNNQIAQNEEQRSCRGWTDRSSSWPISNARANPRIPCGTTALTCSPSDAGSMAPTTKTSRRASSRRPTCANTAAISRRSNGWRRRRVNRHLATLRAFASWAVVKGYLEELPTADVAGPQTAAWEPRWLDRKDERSLVRSVERYGTPRDVALIVTLLQTGLRVGELVALELDDVELSPRKGAVRVRHGKRDRYREVPLNAEARRVLERYLNVRPTSSSARIFLGSEDRSGRKPSSGSSGSTPALPSWKTSHPIPCGIPSPNVCSTEGRQMSPLPASWAIAASRRRPSTRNRAGKIASRRSRDGVTVGMRSLRWLVYILCCSLWDMSPSL